MKIILLSIMILTANSSPLMLLKGEDVESMQVARNAPAEQGGAHG